MKWLRNTWPLLALGAQFPPQPAGEGSISLGFLGLCIWLPFSPLSVFLAAEARLGCLRARLSVHDVCFASPEVPVLTFLGILLMLGGSLILAVCAVTGSSVFSKALQVLSQEP